MANAKEIKNRIKSVRDTQKITGAMYLIASTKMRKAKSELDLTRPYFESLKAEIKRIFRIKEGIENKYFYPVSGLHELPGSYGYLVITADKGLAGAYNQNVLKEAQRLLSEHDDNKVFVVGEYGRHFFSSHNIKIEKSFLYTAQNPTLERAREISHILLRLFNKGEISKMYVIYTEYKNGASSEAISTRLLPFHRAEFITNNKEKAIKEPFEFVPSIEEVLDNMVSSYVTGYIYSALIDSFCSEQNSRMTAMDSANKNAEELLQKLSVQYNHMRQSAITQEITEVSAAANSMKQKRKG